VVENIVSPLRRILYVLFIIFLFLLHYSILLHYLFCIKLLYFVESNWRSCKNLVKVQSWWFAVRWMSRQRLHGRWWVPIATIQHGLASSMEQSWNSFQSLIISGKS